MADNADLERLSVLVVEDSPFIRELLADLLRAIGVGKVSTAVDGGKVIIFKFRNRMADKIGAYNLKGDGGEIGRALIQGITAAQENFTTKANAVN